MKNSSTKLIKLGLLMVLSLSISLTLAQNRTFLTIGTNAMELSYGQPNVVMGIIPTKFMGINIHTAFRTEQSTLSALTKNLEGLAFGGSIQLFPFGQSKVYHIAKFLQRGFRSGWEMDDSWAETFLSGTFIGLGYEHRKMQLQLLPAKGLNSPWNSFDYTMKDSGAFLQVGYGLNISHLYLEASYRMRFSQPSWEGPEDIFGDELLTSTHPIVFRRNEGFRFVIGVAF